MSVHGFTLRKLKLLIVLIGLGRWSTGKSENLSWNPSPHIKKQVWLTLHACNYSIWEQRQADPGAFIYETHTQPPSITFGWLMPLGNPDLLHHGISRAKVGRCNCEGLCDVPEKGRPCIDLIPGSQVGWGSRWARGHGFTSPSSFVDQKKQLTSNCKDKHNSGSAS